MKSIYKKMVIKVHPDKISAGLEDKDKARAEQAFRAVQVPSPSPPLLRLPPALPIPSSPLPRPPAPLSTHPLCPSHVAPLCPTRCGRVLAPPPEERSPRTPATPPFPCGAGSSLPAALCCIERNLPMIVHSVPLQTRRHARSRPDNPPGGCRTRTSASPSRGNEGYTTRRSVNTEFIIHMNSTS